MAQEQTVSQFSTQEASDISWISTAVDRSPNVFFDAFNLNDKRRAHQRYLRMVRNSDLNEDVKEDVLRNFETWKADHAPQFWLDRRTQSSQIRTAATLVEGSEPYAEQSIRRNATRTRSAVAESENMSSSSSSSSNHNREYQQIQDYDYSYAYENMISSSDQASAAAEPESADSSDVGESERAELLANIEQACHNECKWKINDCCVACLFQDYQKTCVQALVEGRIKKSEIADIMAIIGIFAPFLPTARMIKSFTRSMLELLVEGVTFPEPFLDDAAVLRAVRLWINNERDKASEALRGLDRKSRIMFETLFEQVPMKEDRSVSEETFVVNYVAPILHATLKSDSRFSVHFPNTSSEVQKHQGLKPDRPDIVVKARGREVLYGEVTGLSQENAEWKNKWDLFRLARFGKAFLDDGNEVAPLLQVVYSNGTFMRLTVKVRGIFLLQEVGSFVVPTAVSMIPALLATLPTLFAAQVDLKSCLDEPNHRKRSWGYKDITDAKKRLV
ncbi:hypothetical protein BGZ58_001615 [Dissophora ornata]|nr:hypothetical protein BGZ58_001615 [Dissophora ornata]